jgi:hypothetical protein
MLRNITLTAAGELIDLARDKAQSQKTTLNEEFRRWLRVYAAGDVHARMAALRVKYAHINTGGQKFTREEMNDRSDRSN